MSDIDKHRSILIVDDCSVMGNALRGMLQKMGFYPEQIDWADNAKQALNLCAAKKYQLLMLDFNLGLSGMNGYQLLCALREMALLAPDCVCVVVTADASLEAVRSFVELGADSYLIKPLSYNMLNQRLHELLQHKCRLAEIIMDRHERNLSKLLTSGLRFREGRGAVGHKAQLIMVEACLEGEEYEAAHSLLQGLNKTGRCNKARLLLARAELQQQRHAAAFSLASPLQEDPLLCSAALTLKAEACAHQRQLALAQENIRKAIALCPRRVDRYWLQAFFEMATFDLASAQVTVLTGLRYARHMQQGEVSLQQLLAALYLDMAELGTQGEQQQYLARFRQLSKSWGSARHTPTTRFITALLKNRADLVCGGEPQAEALIEYHRQQREQVDEYRMGLVEEMEWEKLMMRPAISELLLAYYSTIKKYTARNNTAAFKTAMAMYVERWQASLLYNRAIHTQKAS